MFSSVVLPDPDRPYSTTSWPSRTVNETPRSAWTAASPRPNVRLTSLTATRSDGTCGPVRAGGFFSGQLTGVAISADLSRCGRPGLLRRRWPAFGGLGWPVWPDGDETGLGFQPDAV